MMAAVEALIAHRAPGRLRLRLAAHRGDSPFFETVSARLGACPGVRQVEANPLTRSILVHHDTDEAAILAYGRDQELFMPAAQGRHSSVLPSDKALRVVQALDSGLQFKTGGNWNLRELAFFALSVAGVVQMARQNFWPAGLTLFWYATTLLETKEREGKM